LAITSLRFDPLAKKQFEFFFSPDEFGQTACVQCLKAALDRTWTQRSPNLRVARNTLEFLRSKVLKLEKIA
jgi:hypothetical protein